MIVAACGSAPVVEAEPVVVQAPVVAVPSLQERLAARRVHHDDYARRVLYTWTTAPQVEALRASKRLLVAEARTGEMSPFLIGLGRVVQLRQPGHALAALLLEHELLKRRRYAWTSPFATTLGLGPNRYGDALIRVELAADAVIIKFRPGAEEVFAAVDVAGRAVEIDEVVAEPTRIAAVYHVRDGAREEVPFREFVLINETRIAAWSVATPEIRAVVDDEIELMEALRGSALVWLPDVAVAQSASEAWPRERVSPALLERWQAGLAFANDRYRPTAGNFAAICAALRGYDGEGPPLVHQPVVDQAPR